MWRADLICKALAKIDEDLTNAQEINDVLAEHAEAIKPKPRPKVRRRRRREGPENIAKYLYYVDSVTRTVKPC